MAGATISFEDLKSDFSLLDEWEDRYRYIIELGHKLEPLADGEKTDTTKVRGCASQVWLVSKANPSDGGPAQLVFRGDSDAHIVRGLIAILLILYNGKTAGEIRDLDAVSALASLGLNDHLSPQRSNGLASMVSRIRADADAALA